MKTFKEFRKEIIETINDVVGQFFNDIRSVATRIHYLHLNSDSFSEHDALGIFYEEVIKLLDKYCESFIGRYGKLGEYEHSSVVETDILNPLKLLYKLRIMIDNTRSELGSQSELQNSIDEIVELVNHTINKLENLK